MGLVRMCVCVCVCVCSVYMFSVSVFPVGCLAAAHRYDKYGDTGVETLESLDLTVYQDASVSDVLAMIELLHAGGRQMKTDVTLGTSGACIMLVDASEYVDVAVARWVTGPFVVRRRRLRFSCLLAAPFSLLLFFLFRRNHMSLCQQRATGSRRTGH